MYKLLCMIKVEIWSQVIFLMTTRRYENMNTPFIWPTSKRALSLSLGYLIIYLSAGKAILEVRLETHCDHNKSYEYLHCVYNFGMYFILKH